VDGSTGSGGRHPECEYRNLPRSHLTRLVTATRTVLPPIGRAENLSIVEGNATLLSRAAN